MDPKLVSSETLQIYLRTCFGLDKGRFVSAFPKDWTNAVRRVANNNDDPYCKKRITSLLASPELSQSIVDLRGGQTIGSWKDLVCEAHKSRPFNAIVLDENLSEYPTYSVEDMGIYVSESDEEIGYVDISKESKPNEVVTTLAPFLIQNKRLTLVNAYQNLLADSKSRNLFKSLFSFWADRGGREFTVIRSRRQLDYAQFKEESMLLEQFLRDRGFTGLFKYIAVDDAQKDRLHERYLIGPFSGIEMGYGLEINNKPQRWKILLKAPHLAVRRTFMDLDVRDNFAPNTWLEYTYKGSMGYR